MFEISQSGEFSYSIGLYTFILAYPKAFFVVFIMFFLSHDCVTVTVTYVTHFTLCDYVTDYVTVL